MVCKNCGSDLTEDSRFCPVCGAAVTTDEKQTEEIREVQTAPKRNVAAEMKRAYNLSTLSTMLVFGVQSLVTEIIGGLIAGIAAFRLFYLDFEGFNGADFLQKGTNVSQISNLIEGHRGAVFAIFLVYFFLYAIGMTAGILFSGIIRKRLVASAPEKKKLTGMQLVSVIFIALGLWGVGVIIGNSPSYIVPIRFDFDFGYAMIPYYILIIIGAPVFEELIFRKLMLDRLAPYGEKTAIFFTALIFGMAHQNGMQFFLAFFIGLLFAVIYLHTGRIIYSMILHCIINSFATLSDIGKLIFGSGFDTVWVMIALVLTVTGVVFAVVCRKDSLFRAASNEADPLCGQAFKGWGFILAKVIVTISVITNGIFYTVFSFIVGNGALSLLYLIPAALAVTVILAAPGTFVKRMSVSPPDVI